MAWEVHSAEGNLTEAGSLHNHKNKTIQLSQKRGFSMVAQANRLSVFGLSESSNGYTALSKPWFRPSPVINFHHFPAPCFHSGEGPWLWKCHITHVAAHWYVSHTLALNCASMRCPVLTNWNWQNGANCTWRLCVLYPEHSIRSASDGCFFLSGRQSSTPYQPGDDAGKKKSGGPPRFFPR